MKQRNRLLVFHKKTNRKRGLRTWNFQGYWKNRMWKFQGSIKKKWNFQRRSGKNRAKFPWVSVFGLGNPNGFDTILWYFQDWSFILSGIPKDKVTNLIIPGFFSKKVYLNPQLKFLNSMEVFQTSFCSCSQVATS